MIEYQLAIVRKKGDKWYEMKPEPANSNWSFLLRIAGDNPKNLTTKMTVVKDFIPQQLEKLEPEKLQQVFEFSEIWIANFEQKQGSEEAGVRPTIIFENDNILMSTTTAISIPLTTNQRRASVPSSVCIPGGEDQLKIRLHGVIKCEFWLEQHSEIKLVKFIQRAWQNYKIRYYLSRGSHLKKERSLLFFLGHANQNSLYMLQLSFLDVAK